MKVYRLWFTQGRRFDHASRTWESFENDLNDPDEHDFFKKDKQGVNLGTFYMTLDAAKKAKAQIYRGDELAVIEFELELVGAVA